MSNEITLATLTSNGGRIAKLLGANVHTNLFDSQIGLRSLLTYYALSGPSATLATTKLTMGYAAAAASSETSGGASNTLLSTGNFDLVAARYLLKMQPSDLFAMTSQGAPVTIDTITMALIAAVDQTIASLLTGLFAGVSGNVGTTGVDLDPDVFFDAIYVLNLANNPRGLAAVLHPQQVNDLIEGMRGETGAIQFRSDIQGMLGNPGSAYRATILGVDVYQSDRVALANANADRQGCMFSQGAFAYTLGDVPSIIGAGMINPGNIVMQTPEMFIEMSRDADNGLSSMILNMYPGVAEAEDARAVKITTDA